MENTKREKAFWDYLDAIQKALDTIPETAKENLEDKSGAYFATIEAEGFEYEEGWEFPEWNKPEFYTYKKGDGRAADWEVGMTICENEPTDGLSFLCNVLAGFTTKRTAEAFESFGKALATFVKAEESPEAEAALAKATQENAETLERAGFAVFVPEENGYKEIK